MNAIWTLAYSGLRRKKLQNGLIALLLLLSTLLLSTAAAVISSTSNIFDYMHAKSNGAHQILVMGEKLHDPAKVTEWWGSQPGVQSSSLIPFRYLSGLTYKGKEIPNLYLLIMNSPEQRSQVDQLLFAQGGQTAQPAEGEVWLATATAYSYGIELGDSISFKAGSSDLSLKVAALVVDIPYGGPFTTNSRIWMNSGDYDRYVEPIPGDKQFMLTLRFDNYDEQGAMWEKFEADFGTPFLESKTEFEEISAFYLIMNKIISFIMIFLGIIMMLVALFTIGYTISDAILANYRTIGVLQSIGLSVPRIVGTYLIQYAFLAAIAIVPSLLASGALSNWIIQLTLNYLKTDEALIGAQSALDSVLIGAGVFILVILCALWYGGKARNVQPVQAIRYGMSEAASSRLSAKLVANGQRRGSFERYPLLLVIGLRNLLKNKRNSLLMLLLTGITSTVLIFGFILLNSISNIGKTSGEWGYDASDMVGTIYNAAVFPRESFEQELQQDARISGYGWISYAGGVLPSEGERAARNFQVSVLDGSYDEMGFKVLKGRNPGNETEIALGVNLAKELGKDIGDRVEILINGEKHQLLLSGIYQAIANMSFSARITADTMRVYEPDYNRAEAAFINLHQLKEADQLAKEWSGRYGDSVQLVTTQELLDAVFKEAISILMLPMGMMGLLFIGVTFVIIYSVSRIVIRKESKTYGIYKSIGLTSSKIRLSLMLGIVTLSFIGAFAGMLLGVYALPNAMESMLASYGLIELPLVLNGFGIVIAASVSVVAAALGSWMSSKAIADTSPRILVVE